MRYSGRRGVSEGGEESLREQRKSGQQQRDAGEKARSTGTSALSTPAMTCTTSVMVSSSAAGAAASLAAIALVPSSAVKGGKRNGLELTPQTFLCANQNYKMSGNQYCR